MSRPKLSLLFTFFLISAIVSACAPKKDEGQPVPAAQPKKAEPTPAPPEPTKSEPSKPAPAPLVGCAPLPEIHSSAIEIFVEDMADGQDGEFRLIEAQSISQSEFKAEKIKTQFVLNIGLSKNANLENPDFRISVGCKYLDEAPEGNMVGKFRAPVSISRKNGKLSGEVYTEYNIWGAKANYKDQVPAYYRQEGYSSLVVLKKELDKAGAAHLYKVSDSEFELRTSQTAQNDNLKHTINARFVYVRVK